MQPSNLFNEIKQYLIINGFGEYDTDQALEKVVLVETFPKLLQTNSEHYNTLFEAYSTSGLPSTNNLEDILK